MDKINFTVKDDKKMLVVERTFTAPRNKVWAAALRSCQTRRSRTGNCHGHEGRPGANLGPTGRNAGL